MIHDFLPGDFLIFQVESAFGMLRVLAIDGDSNDPVWHIAAYKNLFPDIEMADAALETLSLEKEKPHIALTNRAFESTQLSRMGNAPLDAADLDAYEAWKIDPNREISDVSVRLLLGLR